MNHDEIKAVMRRILDDMNNQKFEPGWRFMEARALGALEALLGTVGVLRFGGKLDRQQVEYETRSWFFFGSRVKNYRLETYSEFIIRKTEEFLAE